MKPTSTLIVLYALASVPVGGPSISFEVPKPQPCRTGRLRHGSRLGQHSKPGTPFKDANGRLYVRDEKGTIRRHAE